MPAKHESNPLAEFHPSPVKNVVPDRFRDRTLQQRFGDDRWEWSAILAQGADVLELHEQPAAWALTNLPRAQAASDDVLLRASSRRTCEDGVRSARAAARIRATMNAESLRRRPRVVDESAEQFAEFVKVDGLRLRRIMTARYGVEVGGDIHAESMAWAWQNWAKLQAMENPVGYLYRVAQSSARPHHRWLRRTSFPSKFPERWHHDEDSSLFNSLSSLSEAQRVSVLMVHGHQWTYAEVAEALECSVSAVTNHVHRGLATLRRQLESEEP